MNRTKIEWADFSWNPIKGLCSMNCKTPDGREYCYGRHLYVRFKRQKELSFIFDDPTWKEIEKLQRLNPPAGSKIFVCSTMELFHPDVKKEWRDDIFSVMECNKKYTWIILTKLPENIDRPMPENVWLGTSITNHSELWRAETLMKWQEKNRPTTLFISFEPLFESVDGGNKWGFKDIATEFQWVIAGRLTGRGNKYNPKREWIEEIVNICSGRPPVFLKDNLIPIMGEDYVKNHQEWPREGA